MVQVAESEDVTCLPMSQQDEWKDVVPLAQEETASPVCPIAYAEDYKEMMDYLRALMAKGEISQRALKLTSLVIEENPGHYTVWVYRKKLVRELQVNMEDELSWVADLSAMQPKNYQLWHHREAVVEMLLDPASIQGMSQDDRVAIPVLRRELGFLAESLDEESKNFHAWAYRQWLVRTYGLWDQELAFVAVKIDEDIRNNSAWNQRYFSLVAGGSSLSADVVERELAYTLEKIKLAPNNESPWSFIVGLLLRHAPEKLYESLLPQIKALAADEEYLTAISGTPFYWATLVDIYEQQAKDVPEKQKEAIELASSACDVLATECDLPRQKYWQFRQTQL
ncbi:hypothetical protein DL89DRAFT_269902 [Linderina pennispora]|uniref:Protein farnesyltransferase/geranylgeranyltransferase type-1 subunit alpha n=1 Tax=Linderina pennispora TaxID=61395 RepID=A0A1Y1W0M4_9FUNG|nr:uncharacterized protein DL89DRAFT_269902 [Linderina pennispora]ORX66855.1 hypothetical protein DL89DRAFT_269902 [Linderina pennispora]